MRPPPPPPRLVASSSRAWAFLRRSNLNIWKLITVAVGVLHALYQLSSYWFVGFAAVTRFHRVQRLSAADHVLVRPAEFSGSPEIVPLQTRQLVRRPLRCDAPTRLPAVSSHSALPYAGPEAKLTACSRNAYCTLASPMHRAAGALFCAWPRTRATALRKQRCVSGRMGSGS